MATAASLAAEYTKKHFKGSGPDALEAYDDMVFNFKYDLGMLDVDSGIELTNEQEAYIRGKFTEYAENEGTD